MDTVHLIARAASSRWKWFLACWTLRKAVHDSITKLAAQWSEEQARAEGLKLEVAHLKGKLSAQDEDFKTAKDGNRALLRFIHTGHRLNVKFDPDSIKTALEKAHAK